ncbi:TerB family tellurite resistance protein [Pantanalinema rosaneae CENA516]|uniref:tellurite resistance TerB family protein n=1 Tax=Pantanalinema rosaneae TaxID=1620701 RepID=UPI003D6FE6E3
MEANPTVKNLVKILIGTAWIDGKVQPEERDYLHRVAKEKGIADDPEIQPLLYELRAVSPAECYGWVKEYLGDRPSSEACQQLIEAISGLIYSDGTVDSEEAKLLTNLQLLDPSAEGSTANDHSVLRAIRNVYQRWIAKLEN